MNLFKLYNLNYMLVLVNIRLADGKCISHQQELNKDHMIGITNLQILLKL